MAVDDDDEDGGGELPGIGIFGTSASTSIIVPRLRASGFAVRAIWGDALDDAERCASRLGIPFATNRVDDVLLRSDVHLVFVLCPPALHSQVAVKALGIGKHVAIEAPAGTSQAETLRMVQAAQYYPSLISVAGFFLRCVPAFVKLREALRSGLVGPSARLCDVRVTSPSLVGDRDPYSWACDGRMGGGALNLFGGHVVDLLRHVTGLDARRVRGDVRTFASRVNGIRRVDSDDLATFQMEMDGGAFATVTVNAACFAKSFAIEVNVRGAEGQLHVAPDGTLAHRFVREGDVEEVVLLAAGTAGTAGSWPRLPPVLETGAAAFCRLLADETRTKKGNGEFAGFGDALYVQAVVEAVRRSSREKAWTKVSVASW